VDKTNKCVSKTHIDKRGGAVKTMRNIPPPRFQRQHFSRSSHASTYSTQGIDNDVSTRLPNITSASLTLIFELLTPEIDRSCPCLGGRFVAICIEIGSFIFEVLGHKLVTGTNKPTDEGTGREQYASG